MNLEQLTALKNRLKIEVEWDPDVARELIKESARADVDVRYFEKEYEKAKESLRRLDPLLYKEMTRKELSKNLLTMTIVNTYELLHNRSKKE